MPHLPESARLWLERADMDYIGPFVKAWAAFNAWFREASHKRRDVEGLCYVKERPNPVRNAIVPFLQSVQRDGTGNVLPDPERHKSSNCWLEICTFVSIAFTSKSPATKWLSAYPSDRYTLVAVLILRKLPTPTGSAIASTKSAMYGEARYVRLQIQL